VNARVVFANGSRALSHNLDDLYTRWQLKHEVEIKVRSHQKVRDEVFIDYTNPQDLGEARKMRAALTVKVANLQMWISDKRKVDEYGFSLKPNEYQVYKNTLKDEILYFYGCLAVVNDFIKDCNIERSQDSSANWREKAQQVAESEGDIWFIVQAFDLLNKLKKTHKLRLTEEQQDIMSVLAARIKNHVSFK